MTVDPRNFLLNTDYEMDKIVLFKEGNFTQSLEIPHGLSYIPLPFGVWSTDSNFSSTNTISGLDSSGEHGYVPQLSVSLVANSTKLVLESAGNTNNAPIYYRIYALEPNGSHADAPATSSNANKFVLNTDYNYTKLFTAGEFTASGQVYNHNLGYVPQVLAWLRYPNNGDPQIEFLSFASEFTGIMTKVTTSQLIAGNFWLNLIDRIYWRIYYDQA